MLDIDEDSAFGIITDNIYFILLALILAFGTLQLGGSVLQTETPMVSVVSCSMYPALNVGDVLLVKGTNIENIEVDDVIVYDVKNEASLEINGETIEFSERDNTLVRSTEIGEIRLVEANNRPEPSYAIFEIEGELYRLNVGDNPSNLYDKQLQLNSATGMDIPIVHRVTEKHEGYVETKGDNNREQFQFEERVTNDQIQGRSIFRIPRIGGIKLAVLDFAGIEGSRPFVIDSYPRCEVRVNS